MNGFAPLSQSRMHMLWGACFSHQHEWFEIVFSGVTWLDGPCHIVWDFTYVAITNGWFLSLLGRDEIRRRGNLYKATLWNNVLWMDSYWSLTLAYEWIRNGFIQGFMNGLVLWCDWFCTRWMTCNACCGVTWLDEPCHIVGNSAHVAFAWPLTGWLVGWVDMLPCPIGLLATFPKEMWC